MTTQAGGKGSRKHGRNKVKCKLYRDHKIREKNKIKRIVKSNGLEYAIIWAKEYSVSIPGVLRIKQDQKQEQGT